MGRTLLAELGSAAPDVAIRGLDQVYPGGAYGKGYQFSDLARHPGVVVVPYTKSVMSFFELYRMNVPLFYPSVALLTKWELGAAVMSERIYWRYASSPLRQPFTPNPNARHDRASLAHWLPLSDPYVFPHVQVRVRVRVRVKVRVRVRVRVRG